MQIIPTRLQFGIGLANKRIGMCEVDISHWWHQNLTSLAWMAGLIEGNRD